MRRLLLCLALGSAPACAATAVPWKLSVSSSRTAIWVGDRFQYSVRVEYGSGVEFVKDHLKKEDLNLQPFDVVAATTTTGDLAGGSHYLELQLLLTTYAVNTPEISIPPITLFYFRQASTGTREDVPADTLLVPAFKIAVRNTVVDASTGIRERPAPLSIPPWAFRISALAGLCGLGGTIFYLGWLASAQLRSRPWRSRQVEKDRAKRLWDAVERVKQMSVSTPKEVAYFYDEASEVLRRLAAERLHGECGFTPDELKTELCKAGDSETHAAVLSELLATCDETRYAPGGLELGQAKRPDFLRKFEELTERH